MRIFSSPAACAALFALLSVPAWAADQQEPPASAQSAASSPEVNRVDETGEPGVTIRQPESQTQITEKRQGGQVTEIKVRKSKNNTYYIRPGRTPGNAQGQQTHPAQWTVKEFGTGVKPEKDGKAPPPPPPAPADKDGAAGKQ